MVGRRALDAVIMVRIHVSQLWRETVFTPAVAGGGFVFNKNSVGLIFSRLCAKV